MEQEKKEYKYMVCSRCLTFNHAPYIVDAMKGFTMQETNFPVVTCIVDDASTDGAQEVILQYLADHFRVPYRVEETDDYNLICAYHNTNHNCQFVVLFLKYNHYKRKPKIPYITEWQDNAKYIAICEGDDYWIDQNKLQKQVGFMESHPDYSLCFGDVIYYNADQNKSKGKISLISKKNNLELEHLEGENLFYKILIGGCYIQHLSVVYRMSSFKSIPPNNVRLAMGDTPRYLDLSQQGKVKYIDEVLGVYNIHKGSATHSDSKQRLRFDLSIEEMRAYYCKKYNYEIPAKVKRRYNKAYLRLLAADIEFSALYEPFIENTWQFWQIRQIKNNTWYKGIYNNYILPIQKIVDFICIKGNLLSSIIWNKL